MNKLLKTLLILTLVLIAVFSLGACSTDDSPYTEMNGNGFTVSVKYDANGGTFATNTSVIVDSYSYDALPTDQNGNKYVSLIAPEDEIRSKVNPFTPTYNGYFLAGWYSERTPVLNEDGSQATYADGTPRYTYGGRWDFSADTLTLDPEEDYRTADPVITLYAAWVPNFSFAFYTVDGEPMLNASGEQYTTTVNPLVSLSLTLPAFSEEGGAMEYGKFPKMTDMTFSACYLGEGKTEMVTADAVTHLGTWDLETATANNVVTNVYVEYTEGAWYHIYTAQQLVENASVKGHYEILCDLDFSKKSWPTAFAYGSFQGEILGNGHTISGITFTQSNAKTEVAGLFGRITSAASIKDLTFTDVTFKASKGTTLSTISLGIFAGIVDTGATVEGITLSGCTLIISDQFNLPESYAVALRVGEGDVSITTENVTFETADDTSLYTVEVTLGDDGMLTIIRNQNY